MQPFLLHKYQFYLNVGAQSQTMYSSLEEYTNAWVDLVNRGGLHQVRDEFYLFIKAVEMEARTIINQELLIIVAKISKRCYMIRSERVKTLKYAGITLRGT